MANRLRENHRRGGLGLKKLAEAVAYHFGIDVYLPPGGPTVQKPERARDVPRIPGGGASVCKMCHLEAKRLAPGGFEGCWKNKGGDCISPEPQLLPASRGVWKVYRLSESAILYAWDGVPYGRDLRAVESVARALGEPWDETTLSRLAFLIEASIEVVKRKKDSSK